MSPFIFAKLILPDLLMFKYMGAVLLALVVQCLGVYQILFKLFTGLNPLQFIRKFAPVMGFAFSTATSNATIPLSIETMEEKVGVSHRISSFTIPLGATINMDGTSIMQGVAVVFVAQAFGIALTPADYLMVIATAILTSIGTAGVPSVGLITLAMVFDSVGLPVSGIGLIWASTGFWIWHARRSISWATRSVQRLWCIRTVRSIKRIQQKNKARIGYRV